MKKILVVGMLGAVLGLSGCQSTVNTAVDVKSVGTTEITVSAVFQDEVAEALAENDSMRGQVQDVFKKYAGKEAKEDNQVAKNGTLSYTAEVSYEQVQAASGLTGIKNASIDGTDEQATVTMRLEAPGKLAEAIILATQGQQDSLGLQTAMLAQTHVRVSVHMAGGIDATSATNGVEVQQDKNTATVDQLLQTFTNTDFKVQGSTKAPLLTKGRLLAVGGLILLMIVALWFNWWRGRRD
jgi:hypothetical protein